jgi:hypothetical protein
MGEGSRFHAHMSAASVPATTVVSRRFVPQGRPPKNAHYAASGFTRSFFRFRSACQRSYWTC